MKSLSRMKKSIRALLASIFLMLLVPAIVFAQSKKELEDKRKKIIRDITATQKMLEKTKANKEATYDRYLALQNQINSRESLIETIQEELAATEDGIVRNQAVIESLQHDIMQMRQEYGRTVRHAFRQKTISNPLLYILSADNLNQAFRRWLFLRKYDERRSEQTKAIAATQEMLKKRTGQLESTRVEKAELLESLQGQKASLSGELVEKNEMLKFLSKDENRLKTDLDKKQAAHEALNNAIEKIISEEVRKRVEESRAKPEATPPPPATAEKPEKKPDKKPIVNTPKPAPAPAPESNAGDVATTSFAKNRGKLPWPVENGFVARAFGRQKHPTLKNIEITNNGVDIRTEEQAAVKAVFEGIVAGTQYIPGHDYTVIIQHGDYYTVYSNLEETNLTKGEIVRSKQVIGTVSTNSITGSSELHFELWHQKERLNPSLWIRK